MNPSELSDAQLLGQLGVSTSTPEQFAQVYGPAADRAGKAIGVNPQALISQWGLETGWGKSVVPGTNNLGNIKDFSGSGIAATDNMTGSRDKYRAFESPEAFADHYADLIQRKYKGAVGAGDDIKKFTGALVAGGYAEDPAYAAKLESIYAKQTQNPLMAMAGKIADAVIPAAHAEGVPQSDMSSMSDAQLMQALGMDAPKSNLPDGFMPLNQNNVHQPTDAELMAQLGRTQEDPTTSEGRAAIIENRLRSPFDNSTPIQGTMALGAGLGQGVGQVALGAEHYLGKGLQALGADQIGGRLVNDAATGRANLEKQAAPYAEDAPFSAGVGRIAGNIAGTAPVGGMLSGLLKSGAGAVGAISPTVAKLAEALRTGGTNLGAPVASTLGGKAVDLGLRAAGGAATGAVTAGLVNPDDALTGAIIGGAFPVAGQAVASGAKALGRALRGGEIAPEIATLANRAKQLGIDIPADRIANSKPLNALSSSLEYVPFSGRTATLDKMQGQLNRAVSRTFGQDSDNVTMALRKAGADLGSKFDDVLQANAVKVDAQFADDLANAATRATKELEAGQASVITNQIDEILSKVQGGQIDGQAAYNIKKTLDRIGKRNSPEGFYAGELRKDLMAALNRSLGAKEAAGFAKVREQYGNMLTLERLAQNGVDGDISIARLANMKGIRSPDLQELADIAAQFLKPREGAHGAAQRAVAGGAAAILGGPTTFAASVGAGRLANGLLNSGTARNAMLGQVPTNPALANALRQIMPLTSKVAPVLSAQ